MTGAVRRNFYTKRVISKFRPGRPGSLAFEFNMIVSYTNNFNLYNISLVILLYCEQEAQSKNYRLYLVLNFKTAAFILNINIMRTAYVFDYYYITAAMIFPV